MTEIPTGFKEMLHSLLGDEASELLRALEEEPVTSVRLNKRKPGAEFPDGVPVKWCPSGLYLSQRPDFTLDPLLHAGAYYVQDASSMIYETVTALLLSRFDAKADAKFRVLDLCASPGGKTSAMINSLPDGSEIIANEYVAKRVGALRENLDKWGYPQTKITNRDSKFYANGGESFDIVAVDAPCSGEGMMRKEEMARKQWSQELIVKCASLQKEILSNAVEALKPGGFLIYSTCTFNRLENEENCEFIKDGLGLIPIDMNFPSDWGISPGIETELPVYRFMPHKTKGEGLFLAVFLKPGEWEPSRIPNLGNTEIDKNQFPSVDVNKETALQYLRREAIKLPDEAPRGMVEITYKGLPLGPAKNIGTRANNLYPKNRRILKR